MLKEGNGEDGEEEQEEDNESEELPRIQEEKLEEMLKEGNGEDGEEEQEEDNESESQAQCGMEEVPISVLLDSCLAGVADSSWSEVGEITQESSIQEEAAVAEAVDTGGVSPSAAGLSHGD
ncbi:histone H3.v1-like [Monodelphis domestica]|uniref:histone H3.v1-like n=1 Tax=Monodelphis domestica TaxID=13616 RepID=UPI0024E2267E|nr:histone H3.v1-like [Monodelphis domestica]